MSKNGSSDPPETSHNEKMTRTVVTKTVEKTGGMQTRTTTVKNCTKDDFECAFKKLNVDYDKFHAGGTSVTKTIVYTDSTGKKEVMEETIETYGDPDTVKEEPNVSKEENIEKRSLLGKIPLLKKSKHKGNGCKHKTDESKKEIHTKVELGKFEHECLEAHNVYRAKHGVPPLKLSKEICAYAQEWADHMASTDTFDHRRGKYGENIYKKWSSNPNFSVSGHDVVDSWYSEIKDYEFGKEPTSLKAGHFTQVVWRKSEWLGVAQAKKGTKIYVVANYDPPGNLRGAYTKNVPPPKK